MESLDSHPHLYCVRKGWAGSHPWWAVHPPQCHWRPLGTLAPVWLSKPHCPASWPFSQVPTASIPVTQPLSPILSYLGFHAFLWLVTGRWDSRKQHHGICRVLWTWWGSPGEGIGYPLQYPWASLMAQLLKNLPAMRETWVWSLGWEGPLENETATHSSILAWRIAWTV